MERVSVWVVPAGRRRLVLRCSAPRRSLEGQRPHRARSLAGASDFLWTRRFTGFAIGAGFALIENVAYLHAFGTAPLDAVAGARTWAPRCCTAGRRQSSAFCRARLPTDIPRRRLAAFVPGLDRRDRDSFRLQPAAAAADGPGRCDHARAAAPAAVHLRAQRTRHARMDGRRDGSRHRSAAARHVGAFHGDPFRSVPRRSSARGFPASSSPTCIACFASSSSSPCTRAR